MKKYLAGVTLGQAVVGSQAIAQSVPPAMNCAFDGVVKAGGSWREGAWTLVEIPGRGGQGIVPLKTRDGVYTYQAYAEFDGITVSVCPNALDLQLETTRNCLNITATPRSYERGVSVRGKVGDIWKGALRCELPLY